MNYKLKIILAYLIRLAVMLLLFFIFPSFLDSIGLNGIYADIRVFVFASILSLIVNLVIPLKEEKNGLFSSGTAAISVKDCIIGVLVYTLGLVYEAMESGFPSGMILLIAPMLSLIFYLPLAIVLFIILTLLRKK